MPSRDINDDMKVASQHQHIGAATGSPFNSCLDIALMGDPERMTWPLVWALTSAQPVRRQAPCAAPCSAPPYRVAEKHRRDLARINCHPPAALKNLVHSPSAPSCAWSRLPKFYDLQVRPPVTPTPADAHTSFGTPLKCCRAGQRLQPTAGLPGQRWAIAAPPLPAPATAVKPARCRAKCGSLWR